MKKKILTCVSVCLLAAALLSTAVFASMDASKYIWATNVSVVEKAGGVIEVDCTVTATNAYPDVGIEYIDFYEYGKTKPLASYYFKDDDWKELMGHNTSSYTAAITYNCTPGVQYYADVGFYAGTYGVAGGAYSMRSAIATARK